MTRVSQNAKEASLEDLCDGALKLNSIIFAHLIRFSRGEYPHVPFTGARSIGQSWREVQGGEEREPGLIDG